MGEQLLKFAVNVLFNRFDLLVGALEEPAWRFIGMLSQELESTASACSDPHKNHPVKGRPMVHLAPAWIGTATPWSVQQAPFG